MTPASRWPAMLVGNNDRRDGMRVWQYPCGAAGLCRRVWLCFSVARWDLSQSGKEGGKQGRSAGLGVGGCWRVVLPRVCTAAAA